MSSYLPNERTYAVCTNQIGLDNEIFVIHPDLRINATVNWEEIRPLLTRVDRKLKDEFTCKTCWSSGLGTIAFGAGVITGLAVAATVATVPVIGWIVGGAIALGCLAYGLWKLFTTPTCNQMIECEESQWILFHPDVTFDKHNAIIKTSMLKCKEGGIIMPFISEAAAFDAALKVGLCNFADLSLNVVASFFSGYVFGYTLGTTPFLSQMLPAAEMAIITAFVYQGAENLEREGIRTVNDELLGGNDNPYYQAAQNVEPTNNYDILPEDTADAAGFVTGDLEGDLTLYMI